MKRSPHAAGSLQTRSLLECAGAQRGFVQTYLQRRAESTPLPAVRESTSPLGKLNDASRMLLGGILTTRPFRSLLFPNHETTRPFRSLLFPNHDWPVPYSPMQEGPSTQYLRFWLQKPFPSWYLGPGSSNIGCSDRLGI